MTISRERFSAIEYALFTAAAFAALVLCVCAGSVNVSVGDTFAAIWNALFNTGSASPTASSIIVAVRLPRVICTALCGASLSLCGAAMQGLLKNPLADGSTLGVSSGASLGAVIAIAFGVSIPGFSGGGTMLLSMAASFLSLVLILSIAYRLDCTLSTNTIILIGVIFSMFASSIISLIITFAGDHVKSIMFWTMGSLSGVGYREALILLASLALFGSLILARANELNAFAVGEDNARSIGVNVKRVKLSLLIAVSAMIGICVSISGTIGFVGLVVPHMTRLIVGANHRRLLPASTFAGATFLMLADLASRVVLNPLELPIGVVTSLIGSVMFIAIFYSSRKARQ